jgi:hypothetical protein
MHKKRLSIVFLPFLFLLIIPFVVQAATITVCTFDKDTYNPGQTGYIAVTIYNDREDKIQITTLTATVEYYFTDGNLYLQSFFTNATLPVEIQRGDSSTFYIPFSLPTNVAPGYTEVYVKAITELWNIQAESWGWSDHPTYRPTIYIESPYKQQSEEYEQQLEEQATINEQLEEQLEGQQTTNKNITTLMYLFGATTIVFATVVGLLFILFRRARIPTQLVA